MKNRKKRFNAYAQDTFKNAYYINWDDFLIFGSKSNETIIQKGKRLRVATTYIDGKVGYSTVPSDTRIIAFNTHFYYLYDN